MRNTGIIWDKMKLIDINQLDEIYENYKKSGNTENFQAFVEKSINENKAVCIDLEPVHEFLEKSHDEDYDYLIECEDDDFEWFGEDYLTRLNFFRALLGARGYVTLEDLKKERKDIRVQFRLIELKTETDQDFIIEDVIRKRILCWETIRFINKTEQYLAEHIFPQDRLYSKYQFLEDIKNNSGYVRFKVEQRQTAEFIAHMVYELTEV